MNLHPQLKNYKFYLMILFDAGIVSHRKEALKYATERCDGTLLYQLYIIANILATMNGVFLSDIIVLYRNGGIPEFGKSEKEKRKLVPQDRTLESSLHFMQGMFHIAAYVDLRNVFYLLQKNHYLEVAG